METIWRQLEESFLNHGRPSLIAFHFYEMLTEAGYADAEIGEVAAALEDIVR